MRRRTLLFVLVVAMLLFTTFAVSSVFCDGESSDSSSGDFISENGSVNDADPCGGGDNPGPGPPRLE